MIYIAGLSYKIIGSILLIAVPMAIVFLFIVVQPDQKLIKDYQRNRIMAFLNSEDDAYSDDVLQQENSVTAIGSGQLTGKGLNNNEVASANKGNFVSENQTDFIFSVAGEELGFIGCTAMFTYAAFSNFGMYSRQSSGKRYLRQTYLLWCCIFSRNTDASSTSAVVTGILPNTGTPLPFVSYGLTSIVSLYIGMGLVLNVGLQKYRTYREVEKS